VIIRDKIKAFVPKSQVVEKPKVVVKSSFELFEPTIEKQPEPEEQVLYDVEDDLL
jgi:hypothetical protein